MPEVRVSLSCRHAPPKAASTSTSRSFALGLLLACACASKGESTASETEPPPAVSETACPEYVAAICTEAGEPSRACQSTRHATEFMAPSACALALEQLDYAKQKIAARSDLCQDVVNRLCADVGESTRACQLVRSDLAALETHECQALDDAYAEVLGELRELEASLRPLSQADQLALVAGEPPALGPADAPITVVLFSDFECPYCATAAKLVPAIHGKHGDEVRVVFRQFPLSFHPHARPAAEAALAAHAQGQFWAYHDRLFEAQHAFDRASLETHAAALGLDMTAFREALDGSVYAQAVDSDAALGRRLGVDGTPSMFINGIRVADPTDLASVEATIEQARQAQ
ncbi:MAG: DsbA family protein [Myxococcales bacterium FL481]|nr:MAG: DsbA family protein [Myxococcales bacterium FL481]